MTRHTSTFMVLALLVVGWPTVVAATIIQCGFYVENDPIGKSNQASCGMSPEAVYSTQGNRKNSWDHCKVKKPYAMHEIHDMRVDLKDHIVTWTRKYSLTDHGKIAQKRYYIKKGATPEVAEKRVNRKRDKKVTGIVLSKLKFTRLLHYDPITQKSFDPPKKAPQHLIVLSDGTTTQVLHFAEGIAEAILTEPTGNIENSWINMRFGKCRIVK
jgi:hypothetical protein